VKAQTISALVRSGWLLRLYGIRAHTRDFYRVAYLGTGLRTGILARLADHPADVATLGAALDVAPDMLDGLAAWLDMGVDLRLLSRRGGRYDVRSRLVRDLLRQQNDPLAAFYEELVVLHHPLITETPERLVSGKRFALGDTDSRLVARTSRLSEAFLAEAIGDVVPARGPVRLFEVGCGSGAHIRTAATLNPDLTAVGLELQDDAAAAARENVVAWGLGDRVSIETGDVRDREGEAEFDVVTLHQNIYYFPVETRVRLLAHLTGFLRPGGQLLVTSICRGGGVTTAGLDLWGAMTEGAGRLPDPRELAAQLTAAGYRDVRSIRLTSDGMYWAFVGTKG